MNPIFSTALAILLFIASTLTSHAQNKQKTDTEALRELLNQGQFRAILAAVDPAAESDYDRRFIAELAEDFIHQARAEAGGAATPPVGKRLRSLGGKYFAIYEPSADNYDEAAATAESFGGRLAEPRSLEENTLIFEELVLPAQQRNPAVERVRAWLGIVNAAPGDTETWTYRSSGRPITFSQWGPDKPNGNDGEGTAVTLFSDQSGKWIDGNPNQGSESQPKCPIIEWTAIPFSADEPRDAAFDLTAPLRPPHQAPAFADLRQRAADAISRQATAPAAGAYATALAAWQKDLTQTEAAATDSGDLETVVAARKEKRFSDQFTQLCSVGSLFAADPPEDKLAEARSSFIDSARNILDQRAEQARPLLTSYRKALTKIESELTREYHIADAISIRDLRNNLATLLGEQRQSTGRPKPAPAPETQDPRLLTLDQLQLDIPDRPWPRDAYDPGTPGSLKGFGQMMPGNKPLDLSRAEGINDFVKICTQKDYWIALRTNGSLVSNSDALNGKTGVWRMVPTHEHGAFLFWNDDTVTLNAGGPLKYEGQPINARQVNWITAGEAIVATMKDGSARCMSQNLDAAERATVEKLFTGVKRHENYRYGIFGIDPEGQIVTAVFVEKKRLDTATSQRFPGVNHDTYRRLKLVDVFSASEDNFFLTDSGDLIKSNSGWFPKKPVTLTIPADRYLEKRARTDIVHVWHSGTTITLDKRGTWHVGGGFSPDENAMRNFTEDMLDHRKTPIRDLNTLTAADASAIPNQPKWASYILWIE